MCVQKMKILFMLLLIILSGCDGENDAKFVGQWLADIDGDIKSELIVKENGIFYFRNMPMEIVCREDKTYKANFSGDWSINIDNRIDISMDNVNSERCNIPSSYLINGFYDGGYFLCQKGLSFFQMDLMSQVI